MSARKRHSKPVAAIVCLAAGLTVTGCGGETADTAHGKTFQNDVISFTYPGNWKITEDQKLEYPYYTTVENSGNAVTIVFTLEAGDDVGLQEFVGRYIDFFSAEMDKKYAWEAGESKVSAVASRADFQTVTERFVLKKLNAASPHTRYYRRKASPDYICYVVSQAPDAELSLADPGFDQIVETLAVARRRPHGVD